MNAAVYSHIGVMIDLTVEVIAGSGLRRRWAKLLEKAMRRCAAGKSERPRTSQTGKAERGLLFSCRSYLFD